VRSHGGASLVKT